MIHWILTYFNGPTKNLCNRSFYVELRCAVIEYENRNTKPAEFLVQLVDLDDPNDQRQEWFP